MKRSITIVGAGATGLAAAYLGMKRGFHVDVIEKSPLVGGLLQTFDIAGTKLEHYYHHFFTHDTYLRSLLSELGIENELKFYDGSTGILRNDRIYPFNGLMDLFHYKPLSYPDKLRFIASSVYLGKFYDWKKGENISAAHWLEKQDGKRATDNVWKPLLDAKFGRHADSIPLSWMVGRLSQRMNSRKGTTEKLGYLHGSLDVLLQTWAKKLIDGGVKFHTSCDIQSLVVNEEKIQAIETSKGKMVADHYLFTNPTSSLAKMVAPTLPAYAAQLEKIYYLGAMCVILELEKPLNPIYWINIADKGYPFTGVIEQTNLVPSSNYSGKHIVYLSRYFDPNLDDIAKLSEPEIKKLMLDGLQRMFPHFNPKTILNTHLFRSNTAATLCDLNFSQKVPPFRGPLSNMYVANMAHVYPDERSLNNSIRTASQAFQAIC